MRAVALFLAFSLAAPVEAAPLSSPRPVAQAVVKTPAQARSVDAAFAQWIGGFYTRARAQGIPERVLRAALSGISYDADVVRRDRNQGEFTKPIWEYLDTAVSDSRVRNGRRALRQERATLAAIEARTGVEAEVVAAVWGMESAYGTRRGDLPVIQSLATLAFDGRRGRFFESQLIAALKILAAGDVSPGRMTGSWAGAMGHTQFIPTSFLAFAVDFDGDGQRDIWSDDPGDALASTAVYLRRSGWKTGQPWGMEVRLPRGFDYRLAGLDRRLTVSDWMARGVRDPSGRAIPNHGRASILLPGGARGVALMVFDNFRVIKRYNPADAYAIGVGHLADRIAGGPAFAANWPRGDRPLARSERRELQARLNAAGFDAGTVDGKVGPQTARALRAWQLSVGLPGDGIPSLDMLKRLR